MTEVVRSTEANTTPRVSSPILEVTEEDYETFAFVTNIILTPLVCSVGLLVNGLGLGVLWLDTKLQKLTIYVYLCALTLFDTMYLFFGLCRSVPHFIDLWDHNLANYIGEYSKIVTIYIDMILVHTSTAIIIVMSIERLMALVCPFTVRHSWLAKYPRTIALVCFMCNVLFLIPFPVNFKVSCYRNSDNETTYYIHYNEHSVPFMDKYVIVQTIIDNYLPGFIILAVNLAIPVAYAKVFKARLTTLKMSLPQSSKQTKITLAVLCITILYFLLFLPNLFIKTMAFIDEQYSFSGNYKLTFWLFVDISNLFAYVNAANDFVIYVLLSDHYRTIFKRVYCKCLKRNRNLDGLAESEQQQGSVYFQDTFETTEN